GCSSGPITPPRCAPVRGWRSPARWRSSPAPGSRCATNAPRCPSRRIPSRARGPDERRPRIPRTVIGHDEVLHVARLARLALSEEELEPMARELSAVLDHVAKIGELPLDDVPPPSHLVVGP